MVHQMPMEREILKFNRHLPDEFKQCSVALEFKKPMPRHISEHFYRVRMTQNMLSTGEEDFWIPEIIQPNASGLQKCLGCSNLMKRVGVMSTTCTNMSCSLSGKAVINGPKRGIHSIKTEFMVEHKGIKDEKISFVVGREWKTVASDVWMNVGINQLKRKGFSATQPGRFNEESCSEAIKMYLDWQENKIPIDIISGCLVILDRRYNDSVLCAVYRTCGILCDQMGWELG